jgi:hypothetical protein
VERKISEIREFSEFSSLTTMEPQLWQGVGFSFWLVVDRAFHWER